MFRQRESRLLFIAGCGFDVRVTQVLRQFLACAQTGKYPIDGATLLLIEFSGYELDDDLQTQTAQNGEALRTMFGSVGKVVTLPLRLTDEGPDFRVTHALQQVSQTLLTQIPSTTDVILDVSSLPRIVYLSLMTSILDFLVSDRQAGALVADGVNFQVLVAEDAWLDGNIRSEDPSEDLVMIPGFGGGIKVEAMSDWPVVWFPMLGEHRSAQFDKVANLAEIPNDAEVCPVLPHPSKKPRRGDNLLIEYRTQLFEARQTPMANVMFAHESHPFEAYRQMRNAIQRYHSSLRSLGGCRVLVTPLGSKLMTIAAGLACFEMKPEGENADYALGIPCAAPTRYVASRAELLSSTPELLALLITGSAYSTEE
jgi:hypothetical protein